MAIITNEDAERAEFAHKKLTKKCSDMFKTTIIELEKDLKRSRDFWHGELVRLKEMPEYVAMRDAEPLTVYEAVEASKFLHYNMQIDTVYEPETEITDALGLEFVDIEIEEDN